jgi:prolyl-tRNA synthetase
LRLFTQRKSETLCALRNFSCPRSKKRPSDAEIVSHKLMLRAGLSNDWPAASTPGCRLALRVLRKVENIVRQEMDRAGAIELSMPAVQPAELWQESGRWEKYGPELLRLQGPAPARLRHRTNSRGSHHRRGTQGSKELSPVALHFYQVQMKFRDEIRPRFGVMRGREFLMKDGYSFHTSFEDLQREYRNMFDTYSRIFTVSG